MANKTEEERWDDTEYFDFCRKLIVVRHGERIDRIFVDWMNLAWNFGVYKPFDLNMPYYLPERTNNEDYTRDSPLTEVGYFEAQSVGRSLRSKKIDVDEIYCSPAFRCVQTATGILKTSVHHKNIRIKVEPGLFEYMGWYPKVPKWFLIEELLRHKYQVDLTYNPIISVAELVEKYQHENEEMYYERCKNVIECILDRHSYPKNIIVVAHGPNLDASVRPLLKRPLNVPKDRFNEFGTLFPFCSFVALEETDVSWKLFDSALPMLSYTNFTNKFNAEFLNRKEIKL